MVILATVEGNDKAAHVYSVKNGFTVFFGRLEGAEFVVSHSKGSRDYKTLKGAHGAAARWTR